MKPGLGRARQPRAAPAPTAGSGLPAGDPRRGGPGGTAGGVGARRRRTSAIVAPTLENFDARPDGQLVSSWSYGSGATAALSDGFGVTSTYPFGGTAVSAPRGYGAYPDGGVGGEPAFTFSAPLRAFGLFVVAA